MNRIGAVIAAFATLAAPSGWLCAEDRSPPASDRPSRLQQVPLVVETPPATGEHPRRIEGDARETPDYKLRVVRIWREGGKTQALVTVQNTAGFAFGQLKLSCTALGPAGEEIGVQGRELAATPEEPMNPGSVTKVTFSFDTPKAEVRSLSCNAWVF